MRNGGKSEKAYAGSAACQAPEKDYERTKGMRDADRMQEIDLRGGCPEIF